MHFKSLLHVRDHSKVVGTAHHLLEYIALHVNMHTGEAFDLTVERLAHRLAVTPQWVGQLRARLVQAGELIVKQSRGRHANVYMIPYERCPACQGINPKVEFEVDVNPQVPSSQPQSRGPATPKSPPLNPKVEGGPTPRLAWIEPPKDLKETRERKEGATPNFERGGIDKPEMRNPFWCDAHAFAHSERQPDHRPDCMLERLLQTLCDESGGPTERSG
jgi:hypothetical protein